MMGTTIKSLLATTLALTISLTAVFADSIDLQDGSNIQGTITAITEGKVVIKTSFAGEIKVDQKQVIRLNSQEPLSIKLDDGQKVTGPLASTQEGQVLVSTDKGNITSSITNIDSVWAAGTEDPDITALRPQWKTVLGFDLAGKTGNSEKFSLASRIDADRSTPDTLLKLYAGVYQTETDGEKTEERLLGGTRFDNYFSEVYGWYVRQELEQDKIKDLDFRSTSSVGLTYRLLNKKTHKLSLRSGLGYQYESYSNDNSEGSAVGDLGLNWYYDHQGYFQISTDLSAIPNFSNTEDFQIYHDTGINFPFKDKSWSIRLGVSNVYDNEPEPGSEELDTTYYTRLQFTWE